MPSDAINGAAHERYLYKPFPGSSHSWAEELLSPLPPSTKALDIGAGSGALGQALKEHGIRGIDAVDTCEETREHLKPIYQNVFESLEQVPNTARYDLILLLDVLEHVQDPKAFLAQTASHVVPGGKILISVPNVAHWSTRLSLLFGFFEYTDRGILDRTHLQFFSRRRFKELLEDNTGFKTTNLSASIPPAEFVLPGWMCESYVFKVVAQGHIWLAQSVPGLFGYQHLGAITRT